MKPAKLKRGHSVLGLAVLLSLAAGCLGSTDHTPGGDVDAGSTDPGGGDGTTDCPKAEDFFASSVQANLGACRVCHIAGGVADLPGGNLFLLTKNSAEDFGKLRAAWIALGGNNPTSLLLIKASGGDSHTGGVQWTPASTEYQNMAKLLRLFADPNDC